MIKQVVSLALLAGSAAVFLQPIASAQEPYRDGYYQASPAPYRDSEYRDHEWRERRRIREHREHEYREHEWREHERRERYQNQYRAPVNNGYYDNYGNWRPYNY